MADMKYDVDTSDLVRARKEIRQWRRDNSEAFDRVNSRMQTFGKTSDLAFNQFGRAATQAQQKTKRFASVGLQQAGYQIGDFAVQLQGGTNAAVAFGQQGSQLLGIFGPLGAVMGAALAIATAFAAPLIDMSKKAKDAEGNVSNFTSALQDYQDATKVAHSSTRDLREEFGDFAQQVRRTSELLSNVAVSRAFDALSTGALVQIGDELDTAIKDFENLTRAQDAFTSGEKKANGELLITKDILESIRDQAEASANKLGLLPEEARKFNDMLTALKSAGTLETVRDRSQEILDYFSEVVSEGERIDPALAKALDTISDIRGASARATSGIAGMADEAGRLARNMAAARPRARPFEGALAFEERRAAGQTRPQMRPMDLGVPAPSGGSSGGSQKKDPREFLESLEREIELKRLLVGVNEEQAERLKIEAKLKERLREVGGKLTEADRSRIEALVKQSEAIRKAEAAEERRRASIERFENQMSDSITNIVSEAKSIEDAFLTVIRNIVAQLFKKNVADPIAGGLGDILGGLGGGGGSPLAGNAVFDIAGSFAKFAKGGAFTNSVVDKPTMFPMGQMGEAGPEAIMPLSRGKNGKLGVMSDGNSGSSNVTIHQSFNFSANGDDSVKRIISQEAPKIAELTQKQILDRRSRGGVFKTTFG